MFSLFMRHRRIGRTLPASIFANKYATIKLKKRANNFRKICIFSILYIRFPTAPEYFIDFFIFLQNVLLNFSHFPIQIGITRYQIFGMNETVSFRRQTTIKKNKIENSKKKHRSNQSRSIYLHGIFRKPLKITGYAFCFGGIAFWHIYIFHVAFP